MAVYKEGKYLGEATREQLLVDLRYRMTKGNFYKVKGEEKLFTCCPGCGKSSFSGKHDITENPAGVFSALPSLVFQCCKWHGHLVNNNFVV